MEKVLDYEPGPEALRYPCGTDIARTLDRIVERYRAALSNQAFDAIRQDAARLRESPSQEMAPGIRGIHRLAALKHSAPIYAACLAEGPDRWDDLLTPARLALLLDLFDPTDVKPKLSVNSLSNVCRNWRFTSGPDDRMWIDEVLTPFIRDLDWAGALTALTPLRQHFKPSSTIQSRLGTLNTALRHLERRRTSGSMSPSKKASSRGGQRIARVFTPYVTPTIVVDPLADPDSPDGDASV